MKKLLYILNDCMRRYSYERVAGLYQAIQRMDEPASLYIMRTDGHAAFAPEHNLGEYSIFRLPDYSAFDGIFLDINSIFNSKTNAYNEGTLHVVEAAVASGRPVISMANDLKDFYYVGIHNYAAMQSVIRHLHQNQGLTDFWFAMGPADNFEVQERAQALRDYCAEHGLPREDGRFYYESFTVECGEHAFEQWLSRFGGQCPQAILCANDRIALGIYHAAEKAGYSIPGDFMVTGFDNDDASAYLTPSLTSIDQLCWTMGDACMDAMRRIWRGEALPRHLFTPTELILRESTGCAGGDHIAQRKQIAEYMSQNSVVSDFSYKLSALQYQLPGCTTIEEICLALVKCVSILSLKGLRLILDSRLFEYGGVLLTNGYSDSMEVVFSWEAGKQPCFDRQKVGAKMTLYQEPRENYMFAPLHFMEKTVGYLCVWDCVEMMRIHAVSTVVNAITVALRNFFMRQDLTYINQVLSGISMKDDLTGLYNRLGYHNLANPMFRDGHGKLGVLFIDMDRLKYINDTFGHAWGDRAIQSVANAILRSVPKQAVPVRYGGDEFLILMPAEDEASILALIAAIAAALPGEAQTLGVPVALDFSSGFVIAEPGNGKTLEDYIREADERMYREKKRKKAHRQ